MIYLSIIKYWPTTLTLTGQGQLLQPSYFLCQSLLRKSKGLSEWVSPAAAVIVPMSMHNQHPLDKWSPTGRLCSKFGSQEISVDLCVCLFVCFKSDHSLPVYTHYSLHFSLPLFNFTFIKSTSPVGSQHYSRLHTHPVSPSGSHVCDGS